MMMDDINEPGRVRRALYPHLLAGLPVLSTLSANVGQVDLHALVRPLAVAWSVSIVTWVTCRWITRSAARASLITGMLCLFYAAFKPAAVHLQALGVTPGVTFCLMLMLLGALAFGSRPPRRAIIGEQILSTIAWTVTAITLLFIPLKYVKSQRAAGEVSVDSSGLAPLELSSKSGSHPPHVFYLILDGYGRSDILHSHYGFDNRSFLDLLAQKGFVVSSEARANYMQTLLSLSSSLNMMHLDRLTPFRDSNSRVPVQRLLQANRVARSLQQLGLRFVYYSSGYSGTESYSDEDIAAPRALSEFEHLLLASSPFSVFPFLRERQFEAHRRSLRYILDELADTSFPRPVFAFAHILLPHPPFVFGSSGESVNPPWEFELMDGDLSRYTKEEYIEGYRGQIAFLTGRLTEIVTHLVERYPNAVIILQGDHGPGADLHWQSCTATDHEERFPILLAIRAPGVERASIERIKTPVNVFRTVFNGAFGTQLEMLPDTSYCSTWDRLYDFTPVDLQRTHTSSE